MPFVGKEIFSSDTGYFLTPIRRKLRISQNAVPAQGTHPPLQHLTSPHVSSLYFTRIVHVMLPRKTLSKSFAQCERHSALLRTVADGCERLTTVANAETTGREQGSTRPRELNENPSLRIREKSSGRCWYSIHAMMERLQHEKQEQCPEIYSLRSPRPSWHISDDKPCIPIIRGCLWHGSNHGSKPSLCSKSKRVLHLLHIGHCSYSTILRFQPTTGVFLSVPRTWNILVNGCIPLISMISKHLQKPTTIGTSCAPSGCFPFGSFGYPIDPIVRLKTVAFGA